MQEQAGGRDFGATWQERLEAARRRLASGGPTLTETQLADLRSKVAAIDISTPEHLALLWSGKDVLTDIPLDPADPEGPKWWDKLACLEARVFSERGIALRLENTAGGKFLQDQRLDYPESHPLFAVARELWGVLSHRFAAAASGRIEIICEGSFDDSVFRTVELDTVLSNRKITAINGLDRRHFPTDPVEAFALLRRWDVERSRRYWQFIDSAPDATDREREAARDDAREIQYWYEQDFFKLLGPDRELPALPGDAADAVDRAAQAGAWKYAAGWREFVREPQSSN